MFFVQDGGGVREKCSHYIVRGDVGCCQGRGDVGVQVSIVDDVEMSFVLDGGESGKMVMFDVVKGEGLLVCCFAGGLVVVSVLMYSPVNLSNDPNCR